MKQPLLNCTQVLDLLHEAELADLAETDKANVQEHLDICGPCGTFERTFEAVAPMVRAALELELPEELQAEIDAAIFSALQKTA